MVLSLFRIELMSDRIEEKNKSHLYITWTVQVK